MSIATTRRIALMGPLLMLPAFRALADDGIATRFRELEASHGGRLGVAVLDTKTGALIGYRMGDRFAMCSTCKALVVGLVLARVDRGVERLDRQITFTESQLVPPFKATGPHVGGQGMTIAALCEAAITVSDSTAANLLIASVGGPKALTTFLRSLGDPMTRLDHMEPALNIVRPGETHDTTSPAAMARTLNTLLFGTALSNASRVRLTGWMTNAKDAATRRLRPGLPTGWRIANKPGTWEGITTNDVGALWPPAGSPIVVAAFLGEAPSSIEAQEAVLADVARIITSRL